MKYYIAGPMRGITLYNFPAFDSRAVKLRACGHIVLNPADMDRDNGFDPTTLPEDHDWNTIPASFDFQRCIDRDIDAVRECDAVLALAGWEKSEGARAEIALAEWLGKKIEYEVERTFAVDPQTGGSKETKLARFDLIPASPLWELAEHYGMGAQKYADDNWRKGYDWKHSFAALMRHAWAFWRGEDNDPETGSKHIIAAAWHCFTLAEFMRTMRDKDHRAK